MSLPSSFSARSLPWRRAREFDRFSRDGTALASGGALELNAEAPAGPAPFPAGKDGGLPPVPSYHFGTALLAERPGPGGFDSAVPSLEALTLSGHVDPVKGFSIQGDVVANDPAFPCDGKVEATYKRDELWRAKRAALHGSIRL